MASSIHERILIKTEDGQCSGGRAITITVPVHRLGRNQQPLLAVSLSPLCIVIRSPLLIAGFTFIYLFGAKVGIRRGKPVSRDRQEVGVDRLGRLARGLRSRLREIWPSQTLLRHLRLAATLPIIGGCITVPNGECVRI